MTTQAVLQAAASTRTPRDILASRHEYAVGPLLNAERYEIWISPKVGRLYQPECEWSDLMSVRGALGVLVQNLFDDNTAFVIRSNTEGRRDMTEDFARQLAAKMAEEGQDADTILSLRFVSEHLANRDVDALCGGFAQ